MDGLTGTGLYFSDLVHAVGAPMRLFFRDPLVHFLSIGVVLFAIFAIVDDSDPMETDTRIVVTDADVAWLSQSFARQWNRQPSATELDHLIEEHIREEVYFREALALGLDIDDPIIRRRLVQKMQFLSEDLAVLDELRDEEIRAYYEEHEDDYRVPPRLTFSHIYFSTDERGEHATRDAERIRMALNALPQPPMRAPDRGDRFVLEYDYVSVTPEGIGRIFGPEFGAQLSELGFSTWSGPIASGFGLHLVRIDAREEGYLPRFEDIRERMRRDIDNDRRLTMNEDFFETLRNRYTEEIAAVTAPPPQASPLHKPAANAGAGDIVGLADSHGVPANAQPGVVELFQSTNSSAPEN